MKPIYTQIITPEERAAAMRVGMYAKFASLGIRPSEIDEFMKSAGVGEDVYAGLKSMAAISLLAGIPIGVTGHVIGNRINKQRNSEKELAERIKYYRNATGELENSLAVQAPMR